MKLYRALLHAYPASFRAEYGEEMAAVFARRRDTSNALWLWIETVIDILCNATLVHLDILRQDLRYAARTLGRSLGFTVTAIVVAALGIGATTAAFTMVNHILLRPFPFAQQERLVNLYEDHSATAGNNGIHWDIAPANIRDWKSMSRSFDGMAFYHSLLVNNITGEGEPQQVSGASMTADMFPVLGVKPAMGRVFTAEDDGESAPGTVVLSYAMWQETFGGDARVLGRKVLLDNTAYTVIGIMPKDFYFPNRDAKLWTPTRFGPANYEDRNDNWVYGVGRLKAGVDIQTARAEMRTIAAQMQSAHPKELGRVGITVLPLRDDMPGGARLAVEVLFGAALCVLLIACTNLANLLLARAMLRRKELAVRAAMGAGRERLVRQMLTESLILAGVGGILGIAMAMASLPVFVSLVPLRMPIAEVPALDWRVLLFAAAVTIATGVGFGVIPAMRACRRGDASGLRDSSRSGGGRRERLRSALVMAEVAGSVVLLVASGLLIRALWRIQAVHPGFRAENVLTLRSALPMPKYATPAARNDFYDRVLSQAQQLPGVTGAAYTSFIPMVMQGGVWPVEVAGQPVALPDRQLASMRFVTPGFFSVMGIPLVAGRDVERGDTAQATLVAVVSESFVKRYWPHEDPMGRHFNFGNADRMVVGVAGEVRVRGLERTAEPQVYLPYQQLLERGVSTWYAPKDLAIRGTGNVSALAPALRRIIHEIDPQQPVTGVRLLSNIVEGETEARRTQLTVLGAFAAIAFLLAAIGIHGLLSFAVSSRTQEIGVRMALGAQAADILGMILRDGLMLATAGIAIGAGLAYAAGVGLQSLLAGVRPGDAATFAAAIALCLLMTLAGSLIPAMRAVRVDPAMAVRPE
jgi:putative ABC transport system permease protein